MDYVKPADVAAAMVDTGRRKLGLSPADCYTRRAGRQHSAAATSLALTGIVQTGQPLVGALIFPVGLILIVLLGLDLVTGSFGLLPLPYFERDAAAEFAGQLGYVFIGNLIGSVCYGGLLASRSQISARLRRSALRRKSSLSRRQRPSATRRSARGLITVFVKAILCNWMVCLADRCGHDHQFGDRQDRDRLYAGVHFFRPGV